MSIGLPDVLFALIIVGIPIWAARKFGVSKGIFTFALTCALAMLVAALVFNWATTFHAVN